MAAATRVEFAMRGMASFMPTLTFTVAAPPSNAGSWLVEGRVAGVQDGDTVTILEDATTQHRVHLAGIDAGRNQRRRSISKDNPPQEIGRPADGPTVKRERAR